MLLRSFPRFVVRYCLGPMQPGTGAKLMSLNDFSKFRFRSTSSINDSVLDIIQRVKAGTVDITEAQKLLSLNEEFVSASAASEYNEQEELLQSYATLDHDRSKRTGFPESVFGEGKTVHQVASILDDMAMKVNQRVADTEKNGAEISTVSTAILATR